jgi:HD-GYP domain-containing protein (c-di-GMP phosphodiesterase class II)
MVYLLLSIIVFLLIILFIVLSRLYDLKLASLKTKKTSQPNLKKILPKFDELLLDMMAIHNSGLNGIPAGRENDFYKMALDRACDIVDSDRGSVMIYNNDDKFLHIVAARGISNSLVESIKLKSGVGIAGRAFEKGEIIFVTNPERNPDYDRFMGYDEQSEPFVAIPLKIKGNSIGVLNIHLPKTKNNFTDLELKFLSILADEMSIMAENIGLYQSIEKFYLELVQTLARIIDAKDSYTGDHAVRARERAVRLAKKLNVPEQIIKNIEYAALLHDMGKIGIDEKIITKPGKLTDDEYSQMKKHPEIAYQILSPIEFLSPVAKIILYHHEWFNGMGYPDGIKGDEIPLGSRIVSVIDAWDAMTSDRPYRKALKREDAIEELKKGSGKQFDPKVVDAFFKLLEEEDLSR